MKTSKGGFRILPGRLLSGGQAVIGAAAGAFVRLGIGPNAITVAALIAGAGAGILIWRGRPLWAFGAGLLCGACDVLDGKVAMLAGRKSEFGGFLDSTLDRYSEFFMYAGAAAWLGTPLTHGLAALAFLGSVMVSYTRARAEGLGIPLRSGVMQRAERLVILGLAILVGVAARELRAGLIIALGLIALFSNITAVQRIFAVRAATRIGSKSEETAL